MAKAGWMSPAAEAEPQRARKARKPKAVDPNKPRSAKDQESPVTAAPKGVSLGGGCYLTPRYRSHD